MDRQKSVLILFFGTVVILSGRSGGDLRPAINPQRVQFFKDALGWMTFRKGGKLMTDPEVENLFLEPLKEKYRNSKFYRTFVIAFKEGVIPRLSLNENDPCDPDYTLMYKDPFNSSVTFAYQKKFTFEIYDNPNDYNLCDYRQGLVCKSSTRKCQCPEGSLVQSIEPGSPVRRCLLEQDEICGLIDIDHGNDPKHSALANNMHHLIFNLEKPPSCKPGTQCRFKSNNLNFPFCFEVNSGPWHPPPPVIQPGSSFYTSWKLGFGRECALDLYADPGSCDVPSSVFDVIGVIPGYTCYNYGPPRSMRSTSEGNRTGFCAHEYGPFGVTNEGSSADKQRSYHPYFSIYIHPRTVPFRGQEFEDYIKKYYESRFVIGQRFEEVQVDTEGEVCSTQKTATLEKVWQYFASLEDDPPPGQDFVVGATKAELEAKLQEYLDLIPSPGKVCKPYIDKYRFRPGDYQRTHPSLKCVAEGSPDSSGNDGKCREPGNLNTDAYAGKLSGFFDVTAVNELAESREERNYRREILRKFPEAQCSPSLGPPPQTSRIDIADVLEGGYCPDGFLCHEDYSDDTGIYDYSCRFHENPPQLNRACLESKDGLRYGKCEGRQLEEELKKELKKMVDYSILGKGDACRYDLEREIRKWIREGYSSGPRNKYAVLVLLAKEENGAGEGFCDRTKLLECTKSHVCECVKNTDTRKVDFEGTQYESDYCYLTTGNCNKYIETLGIKYEMEEIEKIKVHYGEPDITCVMSNVCVYLNYYYCVTEDTGKTGHDLKPEKIPMKTTTVGLGELTENRGGDGYQFAGVEGELKINRGIVCLSIMIGLVLADK